MRRVTVAVGLLSRETLTLAPAAAPPYSPVVDHGVEVRSSGRGQRVLAWVVAGGALAGVAVGTVGLVMQRGHADELNALPAYQRNPCASTPACVDGRDSANSASTLAWVGYAAGGALAVTSLVLFLTAPSARSTARRAGVACGAGPGVLGASCAITF